MCEPTLLYLAKRQVGAEDAYFIDIARIVTNKSVKFDFDLRMRQSFGSSKVTDFDCQNISRK